MATRPAKPCRHPRCPELVYGSGGYCAAHAKKVERERGTRQERGYGKQWLRIRAAHLARFPLCVDCLAKGIVNPATTVHHIDGNPQNNRPENHESVCAACHNRKRINESA